ncbi:ABC transporter ATP-binding protein [Methanofollis formosanus]|uniref:ABC transporter ATP-binding protein n=1 Tax=Methanofollis formosanus TaxID=299308 RepID=A0A8G1A3M0_9EURY|nr:ABC transporter ATP-binding protein [Methanofollis formosanus]QYZ79960.1 ABC transporter ATP-binding protein [Methanofollis formosanus]
MDVIMQTRDLSKAYTEQVTALRNVNLALERGEFVTLLGRSGSGKSTLLNILGGLDRPTGGDVYINGTRVDFEDRQALITLRREALGFVFQNFNLIPTLTARENVEYPLLFNYARRAVREERALALLEMVGLAERADHYPREMSGGEQQRVAIARSLVGNPSIVLADEPTGNLDSKTSDGIFELMREVNQERETTFLIVTHERELGKRADRSIELLDGKVV